MEYGYLKDGQLVKVETPKKVVIGDKKYVNPTHEHIVEAGYKGVKEDEYPQYDEFTQKVTTKIYENGDYIYVKYLVSDIDTEESVEQPQEMPLEQQ